MTPELWKVLVILACVSVLTGAVLAAWLVYRQDDANPFDIDEHD